MSRVSRWLGSLGAFESWRDHDRTYDTSRSIAEKSMSIVVYRQGVALSAQTVRLELLGSQSQSEIAPTVISGNVAMLIVGYRGHPTIADTNIRRGDWFWYDNQRYDVTQVLPETPQRFLALAEASEYGV